MYIKSVFLFLLLWSFFYFSFSASDASISEKKTEDAKWTFKRFLYKSGVYSIQNKIIRFFRKLGVSTGKNTANMSAVAQFVNDSIYRNPIVIFSKTYCKNCISVKEIFEKLKTSYKAVEIDRREDAAIIKDVLEEITGSSAMPRVFLKGECIGGGKNVKALYENGKLEQMLQKL